MCHLRIKIYDSNDTTVAGFDRLDISIRKSAVKPYTAKSEAIHRKSIVSGVFEIQNNRRKCLKRQFVHVLIKGTVEKAIKN